MSGKNDLANMTEHQLRDLMIRCGNAVKSELGGDSQFVLLVFDDPKVAQYIATCERSGVIEAMYETAERLKSKQDVRR